MDNYSGIENYDFVTCVICNKRYKFITKAHLGKHGITREVYAACGYPMYCLELIEKHTENSCRNREIHRSKLLGKKNALGPHDWSNTDKSNMKGNGGFGWPDNIQSSDMRAKRGRAIKKTWDDKSPEQKLEQISKSRKGVEKLSILFGDTKYTFRSSYERRFACFLYGEDIIFEYESMAIPYVFDGGTKVYIPDFYLPKFNLICEVKPKAFVDEQQNQYKRQAVLNEGYSFTFITEFELDNLPFWKAKVLLKINYANRQLSTPNSLVSNVGVKVQRLSVEDEETNKTLKNVTLVGGIPNDPLPCIGR